MIFLLIFTIGFYYLVKGVILKETKVLFIITTVMFVINLLVLKSIEPGAIKTLVLIYVLYSFGEYLSLTYFKKPLYEFPLMSRIKIITEEVTINYRLFKLVLLVPFDIFLILRKQPIVGFKDEIGVDITAKDGTRINIKL